MTISKESLNNLFTEMDKIITTGAKEIRKITKGK